MEESEKIKPSLGKKIFVILLICASLIVFAYIFEKYDGSKTTEDGEEGGFWNAIWKKQLANDTAPAPPAPTCDDEIQNQGERHIDCGGPCNACPPDCSDGIQNQDETKIDCGGITCAACPTCNDNIQNQGERHTDCGGPCNACPPDCSDGIQNQGETGVDCGGSCAACVQTPQRPVITSAQKDLISQTILASAFVKDLPSEGVIALRFYDFFLGERIWHPDILIGKTGILTSGTPDLVLIMHARYISQLNGGNLCEVIQAANAAGEMWTESEYSDLKLMSKYSGMLKYRDCFGF